jgi:hypothetical protein
MPSVPHVLACSVIAERSPTVNQVYVTVLSVQDELRTVVAMKHAGCQETTFRHGDTISLPPEAVRKPMAPTTTHGSNGGFGHVGIHRQLDL